MEGGDVYVAMEAVENASFKVHLVKLELLPEGIRRSITYILY